MLIVAIVIVVVVGDRAFAIFNRLVHLRNMVRESWRNIDTELQRRYDLIPNLVSTVKGYAAHEREVFDSVTQLRTDAMAEHGPPDAQAPREQALGHGVAQLLAVAEQLPRPEGQRAASSPCSGSSSNTEDRIQVSRRIYNANVRALRLARADLPVADRRPARSTSRPQPYFEVEPAVRDAGPPPIDLPGVEPRRCVNAALRTGGSTAGRGGGPSRRG